MKKTQLKDALQNIKKERIPYMSVLIIAMLAVLAYLGINSGAKALLDNANRYYTATRFRDIELTSTLLLSEDDLTQLRQMDGIADAEGVYSTSAKTPKGDGHKNITVVSKTERVNTPLLLEGSYPEHADECVVETELMDMLSLSIGDEITVADAKGELPQFLTRGSFRVTGRVYHPDLYAYESQVPGNRYVVVLPEAFDAEELDGCYMKAELRIDKPEGISYFDKHYKKTVAQVREKLEAWAPEREALRTAEYERTVQEELDKAEETLKDSEEKLQEARDLLDENTAKAEDGEKELADSEQKIADAEKELADAKKELDEAPAQLADAEKQLAENEDKLAAGAQELADAEKQLADAEAQLHEGRAELHDAHEQLLAAEEELREGEKKLKEAEEQLADASQQLTDGYNTAEDKKAEMRGEIRDMVAEYAGQEEADGIAWAQPQYVDNVDDPDLTVRYFYVTDSYTVDFYEDYDTAMDRLLRQILADAGYSDFTDVAVEMMKEDADYEANRVTYNEAADQARLWDDGHAEYLQGKKDYEDGVKEYEDGLAQYWDGLGQYESGWWQYEQGLAEYRDGREQYEDGLAEYEDGRSQLAEGRKTYEESAAKYEDGKKQYEEGEAELKSKKEEFEQGKADLEKGKAELAQGEKEYAEALAKYEEGLADYEEAKESVEERTCRFVFLPARGNGSFTHAEDCATNVSKIGVTFAFLFVLLGALVIYATIGRIINEQRTLVGTQKALGFFSREIFRKHLLFGLSASSIGTVLGALAGYLGVEKMVMISHQQFYVTGVMPRIFLWKMFGIVFAAALVLTALSVYWACSHLLKESARELMLPPSPKSRKRVEKRERKGSLYSRLIFRNMLSEWPRVLITIISIAGCCVLLVIGFTLKDSIRRAIDRQFDELIYYTDRISFDAETQENAEADLSKALTGAGVEYTAVTSEYHTFDSPEGLTTAEIICADPQEYARQFELLDMETGERVTLPERGIYITKRISEAYGLAKGDTFTIYDSAMEPHEAQVAGIFEYYFGKIMLISKEAYRDLFGEENVDNMFVVRREDGSEAGEEKLLSVISDIPGFESNTTSELIRQRFYTLTSVLTMITNAMTGTAAMMAFFVLLNLINMYLTQKTKELTVMRINGFTTREVKRYVSRESVVTTILGIILGIIVGSGFSYVICRFVEQSQIGLVRTPDLPGWAYSALFTAFFSTVMNVIALRKIKHLNLRDAAG